MVRFERALFLSWYCAKGDCSFCYMSTQKNLIKDPVKARRSFTSIFAEAEIARACGWEIEFLSGGYGSFSMDELVYIARRVSELTGKKQWLNLGVMKIEELERFLPYVEGFVGTLECASPSLRLAVCPSKPLEPILDSFRYCDELGLMKAATVIIGLGETMEDYQYLHDFIRGNELSRITYYSLNPHRGTPFNKAPDIGYYEQWVQKTRQDFPNLHITAGAWSDKAHYLPRLVLAGADNITKLPAMKIFGTDTAKQIVDEINATGKKFEGNLTDVPVIGHELQPDIKKKVDEYLRRISIHTAKRPQA